jgi:hypothetical protein
VQRRCERVTSPRSAAAQVLWYEVDRKTARALEAPRDAECRAAWRYVRARAPCGVCVCAPLREGARGDHTCVAVCAHRRPGRHVWRTVRHVCQVSARGWPAVLLVANLAVVVMCDSCTGLFPMTPCRCTVELVKSALFKSGDGFSRVLTYFIIAALGVSARCWRARCVSICASHLGAADDVGVPSPVLE